MNSVHTNFNVLLELPNYLGKKILFISEVTPNREKLYNWIPSKGLRQLGYQGIKAIDMAMEILKTKVKYDIVSQACLCRYLLYTLIEFFRLIPNQFVSPFYIQKYQIFVYLKIILPFA